jgi:L-cysteine desulfidase
MIDKKIETAFIAALEEELIPAMGCTEPIALAYAAAKAREVLGKEPEEIVAYCSGNIIKNVRCVQIPHSHGLRGIEAAVALGAIGGDAKRGMEVLASVTKEQAEQAGAFAKENCSVVYLDSEIPLHFIIEMLADESVIVEVRHAHTNISRIVKNGSVIYENLAAPAEEKKASEERYTVENIKDFADSVDLSRVEHLIDRQIEYNMAIANEGMSGRYGIGIGKAILEACEDTVTSRMKAYAAAASEARMDGCDMPVVINSGSGNQGIASSVPVIVYAREKGYEKERLYRALVFSALMTVYQKTFIGKLSAFCGAVSAACASGAAITYLSGGSTTQIKDTINNTLADIPGIICDGAKVSCAAKIASSIDAAMMAHYLARNGKAYAESSGIIKETVDLTISTVGHIGRVGMKETDKNIILGMLRDDGR